MIRVRHGRRHNDRRRRHGPQGATAQHFTRGFQHTTLLYRAIRRATCTGCIAIGYQRQDDRRGGIGGTNNGNGTRVLRHRRRQTANDTGLVPQMSERGSRRHASMRRRGARQRKIGHAQCQFLEVFHFANNGPSGFSPAMDGRRRLRQRRRPGPTIARRTTITPRIVGANQLPTITGPPSSSTRANSGRSSSNNSFGRQRPRFRLARSLRTRRICNTGSRRRTRCPGPIQRHQRPSARVSAGDNRVNSNSGGSFGTMNPTNGMAYRQTRIFLHVAQRETNNQIVCQRFPRHARGSVHHSAASGVNRRRTQANRFSNIYQAMGRPNTGY